MVIVSVPPLGLGFAHPRDWKRTVSGEGTTHYEYDAAGRMTKVTRSPRRPAGPGSSSPCTSTRCGCRWECG